MESLQASSQKPSFQEAVQRLKAAALGSLEDIRRRYSQKPIQLLRAIDPTMRFPKKIRYIFALIWLGQDPQGNPATRFIIKGPRGGGKSKGLGALGFVMWFLKLLSIVDMGGSLQQAQGVYNYFVGHIYASQAIVNALPDEPTMKETKTEKGNYFKAVAASPKAVRGPHPDVLFIDEACETKDQLILDAMPMVNTSDHSLVVMTSTFHKIFGFFQETWDRADELGWVRLSWDSFDVCKEFDPIIWDDEKLNHEIPDLAQLKERAAGRTGDPEGWIPVENIIQAWREKASVDYFDVEFMGTRPSAEGMVNDPEDVDACIIDEYGEYGYKRGADTGGGIDWGFQGMTVVDVEMAHLNNIKVQLESNIYTQVLAETICDDVADLTLKYRVPVWHVDASHPFENALLRRTIARKIETLPETDQFRSTVVEVPFGRPVQIAEKDGTDSKREINKKLGTEKEMMLGNYRAYFQRRLNRIPRVFKEAIWQHKRYRYQKGSDKPLKEDDHCPDAKMLAQRRWPLGKKAAELPQEQTEKEKRTSTVTGGLMNRQF
ncbi:hypothetical protein ACVWZV_002227 [Bradyrhizobium sp. GM5.1]